MPRGLPKAVKGTLEKARESALLAVEVYNKPEIKFRTGGYIVLVVIAWTSLFHAYFFRKKIKPYYKDEGGHRYKRVDGDYKHWELITCIRKFYGSRYNAERKNLEFIARLRNRIEHRSIPELDPEVFGECQACILNFESFIIRQFGEKYSINSYLSFPLHISNKPPEMPQRDSAGWPQVRQFINSFRSSLSTDIYSDNKYSFQVYLVPKLSNRPTRNAVAVEFIPYDASKPDEMDKYEKVTALIKERHVEVRNLHLFRAGEVVEQVKSRGCPDFHMTWHTRAWKRYKVRPGSRSETPEKCNNKYCAYDKPHRDYVYTQKWIGFLLEKWSDEKEKERIKNTRL